MHICNICKRNFTKKDGLSRHITRTHKITAKDYFRSFNDIKICEFCKSNEAKFNNASDGYHRFCKKCLSKKNSLPILISKFGKIEGEKIYSNWIKNIRKSSEDRCSDEWFVQHYGEKGIEIKKKKYQNHSKTMSLAGHIERFGKEKGTSIFNERQKAWQDTIRKKPPEEIDRINKSKAHTLENFISRFGDSDGRKRYIDYKIKITSNPGRATKSSLEIFIPLYKFIRRTYKLDPSEIYLGIKGSKEYWLNNKGTIFSYDFTIPKYKIIFEYNGEHVHSNPSWKSNNVEKWNTWKNPFTHQNADEAREKDDIKIKTAVDNGFMVYELWGSEEKTILLNKCKKIISDGFGSSANTHHSK